MPEAEIDVASDGLHPPFDNQVAIRFYAARDKARRAAHNNDTADARAALERMDYYAAIRGLDSVLKGAWGPLASGVRLQARNALSALVLPHLFNKRS